LDFEEEVLGELGLKPPVGPSTQIAPPEALIRLFFEIVIASGVMANLADDMRNLQRTEIAEVGEEVTLDQVCSSTMPQKRNPVNFENVESFWTIVAPRIMTLLMNQISEHQRDLRNSASGRTYGEIIAYATLATERLANTMKKLHVDYSNMKRNLTMTGDQVTTEPLYIIFATLGHPNAHETVKQVTREAQCKNLTVKEIVTGDAEMKEYLDRMTEYQQTIIANPSLYTGKAREIAESTIKYRT
jgi:adenylosuccinate lyase